MSEAYKCDVCGQLYEEAVDGTLRVQVSLNKGNGLWDTWPDVDLCRHCCAAVLTIIRPALPEQSE